MGRQLQFDEIGGWSELKLEILKKYAAAYSTILSAQTKASLFHVYIDAFAGAGKHLSKATQEFVPGSPLNALAVQPQFREFHLIDIAPEKIENLRELIGPRENVFIYQGDCNEILLKNVFPRVRYDQYRRGLCVLDPYGLHLDWKAKLFTHRRIWRRRVGVESPMLLQIASVYAVLQPARCRQSVCLVC